MSIFILGYFTLIPGYGIFGENYFEIFAKKYYGILGYQVCFLRDTGLSSLPKQASIMLSAEQGSKWNHLNAFRSAD